ncbi:hypothetical protein U9M48_032773 [Paspalum notatum var. saurae]|uniref:Uncharacterized protein n=1 Tax=Paspalum notatum var. saurae TaxID=547442 RepID=A0AAQ3X640_PASNO
MNRKRSRGKNPWRYGHRYPLRRRRGATPEEPKDPVVDLEDPEQDPDAGDAPPSDDDEDDDEAEPVVTTTHRRFDYPPPVPRMPRETPEMLHYDRLDHLCGDSLPPSRPT